MDVAALADLLHETSEHHGKFEADGDWRGVFDRLLRAIGDHPLTRRILAGEEGKTGDRLLVLPAEAAARAGLAKALRARQRTGQVRDDIDPDAAATGLSTLVMAVLIAILQTGGVVDDERAAGVLAVLDAAIRVPAATGGLTAPDHPSPA
jgi:hypothetical protein